MWGVHVNGNLNFNLILILGSVFKCIEHWSHTAIYLFTGLRCHLLLPNLDDVVIYDVLLCLNL